MSKTLLCHISTPAALKCVLVIELIKPQNVLLLWVFFPSAAWMQFQENR